jgi:thiamine biosynthesis protein ThiS
MKLIINGESREFGSLASVADLISHLGMKPDRVAVELNRELVTRERWTTTPVSEGDQLEIVHFVGGGTLQQNNQPRSWTNRR